MNSPAPKVLLEAVLLEVAPQRICARASLFAAALLAAFLVCGCQPASRDDSRPSSSVEKSAVVSTSASQVTKRIASSNGNTLPIQAKPADTLSLELADGVSLDLVLIPSGKFKMGSPPNERGRDSDESQHLVRISRPFFLGTYEVTQDQWSAVMGTRPSFHHGEDDLPVESVNDQQCLEFCQRLSELTGHPVRLPTEAEWEYAARAGSDQSFSCGAELTEHDANFDWSEGGARPQEFPGRTMPVGSFAPNDWGLHDMHGNVREWCADWYGRDTYQTSPAENPTGPPQGDSRVLRGGCWDDYARRCRSAYRHGIRPDDRAQCNGLRICVDLP